ncbi:hypothetical protein SNEBB_009644 [Seison nebaliae]|nr:hypothetical protein SNEBB_009644 [Seison nebaliae]
MIKYLLLILFIINPIFSFKIGFILKSNNVHDRNAIDYTLTLLNEQTKLLHQSSTKIKNISFFIDYVESWNAYKAYRAMCKLLSKGVTAIVTNVGNPAAIQLSSICKNFHIPCFHIDYLVLDQNYFISLYPSYDVVRQSLQNLLREFRWKEILYIFDDTVSFARMISFRIDLKGTILSSLEYNGNEDFIFDLIEKSTENQVVIDCNYENTRSIMEMALKRKLINNYRKYLIVNLDSVTMNWNSFHNTIGNITVLRLKRSDTNYVRWYGESMGKYIRNGHNPKIPTFEKFSSFSLYLNHSLLLDLGNYLLDIVLKSQISFDEKLSCLKLKPWKYGHGFLETIKMNNFNGKLSGMSLKKVEFEVLELRYSKFRSLGTVNKDSVLLERNYNEDVIITKEYLANMTLIVSVKLTEPYIMLKNDSYKYKDNERFEGFAVDLFLRIKELMKKDDFIFNYRFKQVEDGKHGQPLKNNPKVWNGMIHELMTRKADLAISDLTITLSREQVIDFTKPFFESGIGILFKKSKKKSSNLFSFLSPFSINIWLYIVAAYLGITEEIDDTNQITLLNALWFNLGCFMQQGSEIPIRAFSTRLLCGFWWFFCLIIVSSYTANLAAFLTSNRMQLPIRGAEDLAKQTEIKYGALRGGSSQSFFIESRIPTYERMYNFMAKCSDCFVPSNGEGFRRVKEGKYAFIMESKTINYMIQRDCELTQVGGLLASKGYGIGTPTNSPFRDILSDRILQMQEMGDIQSLYNLWWKKKKGGGKCISQDTSETDDATTLGLANVGGVFLILCVGIGIGFIMACLEFSWHMKHKREKVKKKFKLKTVGSELNMRFFNNNKTASSESESLSNEEVNMSTFEISAIDEIKSLISSTNQHRKSLR